MSDADDLLNEATRLAVRFEGWGLERVLRDLVERVRAAEARNVTLSETRTRLLARYPHAGCDMKREDVEAERDSARAKLDTVRALADEPSPDNDWGWGYDAAMDAVLAILDGKDTK